MRLIIKLVCLNLKLKLLIIKGYNLFYHKLGICSLCIWALSSSPVQISRICARSNTNKP